MIARIDIRSPQYDVELGRTKTRHIYGGGLQDELKSRWIEIIDDHLNTSPLASGDYAWQYKQRLISHFDLPMYWQKREGTIRIFKNDQSILLSIDQTLEIPVISTVMGGKLNSDDVIETPYLLSSDINILAPQCRKMIFDRVPFKLYSKGSNLIIIDWIPGHNWINDISNKHPIYATEIPSTKLGIKIHKTSDSIYDTVVLNLDNEFIFWFRTIYQLYQHGDVQIKLDVLRRILELLFENIAYSGIKLEELRSYIIAIEDIPDLPQDLKPPLDAIKI